MMLEPLTNLRHWFDLKAGDWYEPVVVLDACSGHLIGANTLRASYYPVFRRLRFDYIRTNITTAGAAGALIRLGVYDDLNGYPNNLIVDSGDLNAAATGYVGATINVTLNPGVYWVACLTNDGAVQIPFSQYTIPFTGSLNPQYLIEHYYVSYTYGALPAVFPAGASLSTYHFNIRLHIAEVLP